MSTDLARVGGRQRTPARPGPGPIADDLVRRLEIVLQRRASGRMPGDHRGLGFGDGLDLDRLRPYEPGDDVRRIDWSATARSLVPQVREDLPDRQLTAWLLLDTSASMHFGTADRRKADVAEGVALVVGRYVARRTDRLGVITFDVGRPVITPPAGGRRGMLGLARALATDPGDGAQDRVAAAPAADPAQPSSLARALRTVAASRTSGGLVVVISDFLGERDWIRPLTDVVGRHSVLAVEIGDRRERELVDVGELTLVDPETGRSLRVDTSDRRLRSAFSDAAAGERAAVSSALRRLGVRHLQLTTDGSWLAAFARGLETNGLTT
jgi:uncharacterized protein (DUF58 family)